LDVDVSDVALEVADDEADVGVENHQPDSVNRWARSVSSAPVVAAGVVLGMYLPLAFFRFGIYDDFYNSWIPPDEVFRVDAQGARPVAGVLHLVYFGLTAHIDGFGIGRALAAVLFAVQTALLTQLLRRLGMGGTAAAIVAIAAHATAGVQMVTAWGPTLFVLPVSSICGGLCGWLLWSSPRASTGKVIAGSVAGVIALSIYQPGGLAIASVFALCTALDRDERYVVRTIRFGIRLVPVLVGYVAVMWISGRIWGTLGARNELTDDPGAKLDWFVDTVVPRVVAPFQLSPGRFVIGVVTGLLILASAAVAHRSAWAVAGRASLVAGSLMATYAPNLVVAESWASARSLFVTLATSATLAALGVRNLIGRDRSRRGRQVWFAAGIGTVGLLVVNAMSNTIGYVAEPNSVELRAVQAAAVRAADDEPPVLVFVAASFTSTLADGVSMDEFGYPTTAASWSIPGMVEPVLDDVGFSGDILVVTTGYDPTQLPEDAVVIVLDDVLRAVDSP
jgi:hypothetical protein